MSLESGERQVAPTLDGIRRDHVARYEFASRIFRKGSKVIDFACGIGYGCRVLKDAGHQPTGFDIDDQARFYGYKHYAGPDGTDFDLNKGNGNVPGDLGSYDGAVCFETIEHLQDPKPLLKSLRQSSPLLICSVPNEEVMPYEFEPGKTYAFHWRHYTKPQFKQLLESCGWHIIDWYGQEGPESEVEHDNQGRTLIAVCEHGEMPAEDDEDERHIAILGLGPSLDQYLELTKRLGGRSNFCHETWAINALGDVFQCDLIFHMDDVRIQEIRAEAAPASNIAAMVDWMKRTNVPVMTSFKHPDYPSLIEFPLEDMLNTLGHDYFNSTAAYAIAFAIYTGATKISLFGIDYTYPNAHHAEKGRACVEFWLGYAYARGIKINLPKTTSLMDSMYSAKSRLYGYDCVDIEYHSHEDGSLKLKFIEKTELPTAEQIEKNYDHSAPVAEQHLPLT